MELVGVVIFFFFILLMLAAIFLPRLSRSRDRR
jgi:hypothetical protein